MADPNAKGGAGRVAAKAAKAGTKKAAPKSSSRSTAKKTASGGKPEENSFVQKLLDAPQGITGKEFLRSHMGTVMRWAGALGVLTYLSRYPAFARFAAHVLTSRFAGRLTGLSSEDHAEKKRLMNEVQQELPSFLAQQVEEDSRYLFDPVVIHNDGNEPPKAHKPFCVELALFSAVLQSFELKDRDYGIFMMSKFKIIKRRVQYADCCKDKTEHPLAAKRSDAKPDESAWLKAFRSKTEAMEDELKNPTAKAPDATQTNKEKKRKVSPLEWLIPFYHPTK